jgi:hypothetical protein
MTESDVDLPAVIAEVSQCFHAYEAALMRNDIEALNGFFWADERTTRYGIGDRQLGFAEIVAFRATQPAPAFTRRLHHLRIHAFGLDCAVAQVEFTRSDTALHGFQSQTWVRLHGQWKIAAAHVSMIPWEP